MGPKQVLPLQVRVDLVLIVMKRILHTLHISITGTSQCSVVLGGGCIYWEYS